MALNADDVFELITEKSLEIPIATLDGLKRMNQIVKKRLKENPVEDIYSIIKSVDFDDNVRSVAKTAYFDIGSTYVDAMLKLKLGNQNIGEINRTIRSSLIVSRMNLVSYDAERLRNTRYVMPIRRFSKKIDLNEELDLAYIVEKNRKGELHLPKFNGYEAPIVRFNYSNKKTGKRIVEQIFLTLSDNFENKLKL